MGCNCGTNKTNKTYVVRYADGTSKSYKTEVEASAAAKRSSGATYSAVG